MRGQLGARLFGPAQYRRRPPVWLMREATAVAVAGTVAVAAAGIGGVLAAWPMATAAMVASIVLCALLLHLVITGAGRLLVGAVALVGVLLAFQVPGVASEAVLAQGGRTQMVVVTAVTAHGAEDTHNQLYLCSVRREDGSPVPVRLWRGCGPALTPGDRIGMVYDPAGRVLPRGLGSVRPLLWSVIQCALLAAAQTLLCLVAVVRSYRVAPTAT